MAYILLRSTNFAKFWSKVENFLPFTSPYLVVLRRECGAHIGMVFCYNYYTQRQFCRDKYCV
jgi:hypothetical protein